jgi:hypothetical protein
MNNGIDEQDPGSIRKPGMEPQPDISGAREASFTPQAYPPPPRDPDRDRRARTTQWVVVAAAAVLLVVITAAGGFAIGYAVGRRNTRAGITAASQNGPLQRLESLLQSGASVLRGQVTEVNDGSISVETPQGSQAVTLTAATRFLGAGAAQGVTGPAAQTVKKGDTVLVVARKTASGNLEAIAVRIQNAGLPAAGAQDSSPNGGNL